MSHLLTCHRNKFVLSVLLLGTLSLCEHASARDLVDAAQQAQTLFNHIGIAAVGIGITLGGILFALGAAQIGRMLLISGLIGACAVLGAPAIVSLIGRIFGAMA